MSACSRPIIALLLGHAAAPTTSLLPGPAVDAVKRSTWNERESSRKSGLRLLGGMLWNSDDKHIPQLHVGAITCERVPALVALEVYQIAGAPAPIHI